MEPCVTLEVGVRFGQAELASFELRDNGLEIFERLLKIGLFSFRTFFLGHFSRRGGFLGLVGDWKFTKIDGGRKEIATQFLPQSSAVSVPSLGTEYYAK